MTFWISKAIRFSLFGDDISLSCFILMIVLKPAISEPFLYLLNSITLKQKPRERLFLYKW